MIFGGNIAELRASSVLDLTSALLRNTEGFLSRVRGLEFGA